MRRQDGSPCPKIKHRRHQHWFVMSANTIVKRNKCVTAERSREIILLLLNYFGPTARFDLHERSILMANDKIRRCLAGKDDWPKRTPKLAGVANEYGSWPQLLGRMLIAKEVSWHEENGLQVWTATQSCDPEADDIERLKEIELIVQRKS